ncbi:integrase-recombinase protein : Integrase-recombinase protein OS=Rhodopirellula sallentina SM41 GN=RSSM_04495 PE=4 SV=1: Phage_integrase [Gemmataceae bacterium]|nr:integrase-recombinase protein : Integrase-recombinase protein OS=Rhodopirellula sallentina SM41 GN=RSSM_04495 PE=4 SV=1: Phage_integrase [Gemmataceae bacterium]VTT97959.1 integrase-recombinase protein : Integrase-recombinase protein OS=Rhodopirellula sallentina SM41 GN=RSSM_04495 PE=4 SV=1: Phage_integrase [Gemmataceae bacterium]
MAHLVRQSKTYFVDRDGRRVPKGTRGAKKVTEKSAKWYGCGIPGLSPSKRVPLAKDKEAAQRMLAAMVRAAEQGNAQMLDRAATAKPLVEHLKDFESDLRLGIQVGTARRKRTAPSDAQVNLVVQRTRDAFNGCGFRAVADIKDATAADKLSRYLRDRMGKPRKLGGFGAQTATFALADARRFARWIARKGTGVSPEVFDSVAGFDPDNDRRHSRREVSPGELDGVLEAANASQREHRGLTGSERYHLYLTAFATGFRASELAALTPAHFHLDADPPAVSLPGKVAKNKKAVRPPIPAAVAVPLRSFLAGRPAGEPVWGGKWHNNAAAMLRIDLAAAGVPYCVEGPNGKEYADFHALRHTFLSALSAAGVGPKDMQTLARHSDPRLTLGTYTHARSAELVKAVNRLRIPGAAPASPLAGLDREQLEGITLGLLMMLGTFLRGGETGVRVTPPVTPEAGISGDFGERMDTSRQARR